jgi:cell division cycle 20-like protein 1 (cofactor of APC complex)
MADGLQISAASLKRAAKKVAAIEAPETPTLISPPDTKTPPTASHKRQKEDFTEERNSEPVDPSVLSRALEDLHKAGKVRERTPTASPSRKRQRIYGDR